MTFIATVKDVLNEFFVNTVRYFKDFGKDELTNFFKGWSVWEQSWLIISTIAITTASIMTWDPTNVNVSIISLIASISGIWCVVLVAKGKISNYFFGTINVIFYAIAAYNWQVYGDFMLNIFYYLPMQFYGWYIWTKPAFKNGADIVRAKMLSLKGWVTVVAVATVAVLGYGFFLQSINNVRPFVDAVIVVCSILAQFLMSKRYAEQWILWIVVDVLSVYIWSVVVFENGGLANAGILVMFCAWTVNAIYGYINWLKMSKE